MNPSIPRPGHVSPAQWERLQRDLETYRRELPGLLHQGHAGRYAVIKDDLVLSVWDTLADALQAAGERFGDTLVATYKINPLDVERFAHVDARKEAACPS
jgi:hypothetical protein